MGDARRRWGDAAPDGRRRARARVRNPKESVGSRRSRRPPVDGQGRRAASAAARRAPQAADRADRDVDGAGTARARAPRPARPRAEPEPAHDGWVGASARRRPGRPSASPAQRDVGRRRPIQPIIRSEHSTGWRQHVASANPPIVSSVLLVTIVVVGWIGWVVGWFVRWIGWSGRRASTGRRQSIDRRRFSIHFRCAAEAVLGCGRNQRVQPYGQSGRMRWEPESESRHRSDDPSQP